MKREHVFALALGGLLIVAGGAVVTKRPATPEEKKRVLAAVEKLGWPAQEFDIVIRIESGWNAAARNPNGNASGLIQFMPATLKLLGFHPELPDGERAAALRQLGPVEQLPLIEKYLKRLGRKWAYPGDSYLTVAAPGFVGEPDETVIYPKGSKAWEQNPGLREPEDGAITARSIRSLITRRLPT